MKISKWLNSNFFGWTDPLKYEASKTVLCGYQQVHIEFTEGEDKITLEGPTKDVQIVHGQIEVIVTDLVRL